ncbi:Ankyrin repeat-containing domain,Ankyrin repeat [Cinara cedri]|uniref:Ankyrin repeat-containing domain,Ankyrin repeat n=1 Tax=Cinara cedri TaxID=506608 RepID=A0A5E4MKK9_9HEMI|nr:Ankyrin repeat-containing domain,Ankyrin repeat [Cinara cedri]
MLTTKHTTSFSQEEKDLQAVTTLGEEQQVAKAQPQPSLKRAKRFDLDGGLLSIITDVMAAGAMENEGVFNAITNVITNKELLNTIANMTTNDNTTEPITEGAMKANGGWTPLHSAAYFGQLDIVKFLINTRGADFNAKTDQGWTPLLLAVQKGNLDVVKYLVDEKGADFTLKNSYGNTPLHFAASSGKLDVAKYLIDEKGVDFNLKDSYGNTPLHFAASSGNLDLVKYLVDEKGADFNLKNYHGRTSLHKAANSGNLNVMEYLIDTKGADFNLKDSYGWTPLHFAAYFGKLGAAKYLVDEKGADFTLKDSHGKTPLHRAAEGGKLDVVKYLVDQGADFTLKDGFGKTPLYLAVQNNHPDLAKYLVDQGADFNLPDNDGITPLQLVTSFGNSDLFESEGKNRSRRDVQKDMEKILELQKMEMANIINITGTNSKATSGAGRATLWMPQFIRSMVQGVYGLISAKPVISAVIGHGRGNQKTINPSSTEACVQGNASVLLLLAQNFSDRNCPKFRDVTFEETQNDVQSNALNITDKFEECIREKYGIRAYESIDLFEMHLEISKAMINGSCSKVPGIILSYATSIVGSKKAEVITFQVLESVANAVNQTSELPTCLHDVTVENGLRNHGKEAV